MSAGRARGSGGRPIRVLLTGATGFLGHHLMAAGPERMQIVAGLRSWDLAEEWGGIEMDLSDPLSWRKRLYDLAPDAILHAAALADTGACEKNPQLSHAVNLKSTEQLARHAGARGIPFLFCSTDLVFDGNHAPYKPADAVDPQMVYGLHKAGAEAAVHSVCPEAIIARLPLMYGYSSKSSRGLIGALRTALSSGKTLRLFHDEYRTAANAARVAEGLWTWLLAKLDGEDRSGTWHFGGAQRLSRVEIAQAVAGVWELDSSLIQSVSQAAVNTGSPRPQDVSLDSEATYAKAWRHGSLIEELSGMNRLSS